MSGHNKWSKIKHKKGATDARKSKIWTKIIREISIAAKIDGIDVNSNSRLRKAIYDAKAVNILKDTINRAIQKGSSSKENSCFEELIYEGYGPGGVAIMVECLTDNRNRTSSDVRSIFNKKGGKIANSGSVMYSFKKFGKFILNIEKSIGIDDSFLLNKIVDYDIQDIDISDKSIIILCSAGKFQELREFLISEKLDLNLSEILMIPNVLVSVSRKYSKIILKLIELLEDLDDVQNVWTNMDFIDSDIEVLS